MLELAHEQKLVARTIREFVEREVIPVAADLEHKGEYPHGLVSTMTHRGMSAFVFEKGAPRVSRWVETSTSWDTRPSRRRNCTSTIFRFPPPILLAGPKASDSSTS